MLGAGGCAGRARVIKPAATADQSVSSQPLQPYSGPRAMITIADVEVKAAKAGSEIGAGLREMMVTALVNSQRFQVIERQAVQETVLREQELAAKGSTAQRAQIKPADIIVSAAVTEFEPQASGGTAGVGGGGGVGSGTLGGLLGATLNRAHIALDVRVINAATSEVLAATRVQGQASDVAGGFMAGFFGGWALGSGLGAYANTPMEKAVRICIVEAVRYVSQAIPANYYQY